MKLPGYKRTDGLLAAQEDHPTDKIEEYIKAGRGQHYEPGFAETRLIEWYGAEDTPINRWASLYVFGAWIDRTLNPGKLIRCIVVLIGEEDIGKTELIKQVLPPEFRTAFLEDYSFTDPKKVSAEATQGKAIVELSELEGLTKADVRKVKSQLSRCVDSYRPAYGRTNEDFPRRYAFVGTTNENEPLPRYCKNTRFLPVYLKKRFPVHEAMTEEVREKIRNELVALIEAGEFDANSPEDLKAAQYKLAAEATSDDEYMKEHLMSALKVIHERHGAGAWFTLQAVVDALAEETKMPKKDVEWRVGRLLPVVGCERKRVSGKKGWKFKPDWINNEAGPHPDTNPHNSFFDNPFAGQQLGH